MKKAIVFMLCALLVVGFYGCAKDETNGNNTTNNTTYQTSTEVKESTNQSAEDTTNRGDQESVSSITQLSTQKSQETENRSTNLQESTKPTNTTELPSRDNNYTLYGNEQQYILVHKEIDLGSFDLPHKTGDSIRMRHSDINAGNQSTENVLFYDYDLTFKQILTGDDAVQKLKEICSNFDQESYVLENSNLYLLHVSVKYRADSTVKDRLPVDLFAGAVNVRGDYVQKEHRFDIDSYTNLTPNGEGGSWYAVVVPNDTVAKPVIAIGSEMEYPGPVAAVYCAP